MKTFFKSLLMGVAMVSALAHADVRGSDGWPLPWPFPWAKECPMDWKDLDGTYTLTNDTNDAHWSIRVDVLNKNGMRLVRVSRYSLFGHLLYDGAAVVTEKQKIIGVYLQGVNDYAKNPPVWAVIKMHYDSSVFSCSAEHLVPIMTLQVHDETAPPDGVDYRMTKVR